METRISAKGQLTLPTQIRRRLGIKAGDRLVVRMPGERQVILEVKKSESPDLRTAFDILRVTAGSWSEATPTGEAYTAALRALDADRWKELPLD